MTTAARWSYDPPALGPNPLTAIYGRAALLLPWHARKLAKTWEAAVDWAQRTQATARLLQRRPDLTDQERREEFTQVTQDTREALRAHLAEPPLEQLASENPKLWALHQRIEGDLRQILAAVDQACEG